MLQRTILRASRQAARRTPPSVPLRQQVNVTRVVATPAIRWYSDAPAAKEGEAAEKKDDAPSNETAQLKEQVEKKDKEIVELKVRPTVQAHDCTTIKTSKWGTIYANDPNRTSTSAQ